MRLICNKCFVTVVVILVFALGCSFTKSENSDSDLFKHPEVPHPDEDTSEFGKYYAKARNLVRHSYSNLLNDIGETNFEVLENVDAFRVITSYDNTYPGVISVIKNKNDVILKSYYVKTIKDTDAEYSSRVIRVKKEDFVNFTKLMKRLKKQSADRILDRKQMLKSIMNASGICFIEGVENGRYFKIHTHITPGGTYNEACYYCRAIAKSATYAASTSRM